MIHSVSLPITRPSCDKSTQETARYSSITENSPLQGHLHAVQNSQQALIGKTISPRVAEKTLHLVNYDGTARVVDFKATLTSDEFKILTGSIITPLQDTPAKPEGKLILTPVESLVKIVGLIKKSALPETDKAHIVDHAKALYLEENITEATIEFFYLYLKQYPANDSGLMANIESLLNCIEKRIYYTKHHDNFFGRLFDSRLAEKIISAPSAEMLNIAQSIRDIFIKDFNNQGFFTQHNICSSIKNKMKLNWVTWYASIPEVTRFADKRSPENFLAMLKTNNPLWPLLMMNLSVNYMISPTSFENLRFTTFHSYTDIIQPQRKNQLHCNSKRHSNRTGIRLAWQMANQNASSKEKGIRPIDQTCQNITKITRHDKMAFRYEKPVGVGMSGSANLLNVLFEDLKKKDDKFHIEHARLLAASFLIYSGGHSLNEAWTVYNNYNFTPVPYKEMLPGDGYLKAALDYAWETSLEETLRINA